MYFEIKIPSLVVFPFQTTISVSELVCLLLVEVLVKRMVTCLANIVGPY